MHSLDSYGAFECLIIAGGGVFANFVLHGVGHLPTPEPPPSKAVFSISFKYIRALKALE